MERSSRHGRPCGGEEGGAETLRGSGVFWSSRTSSSSSSLPPWRENTARAPSPRFVPTSYFQDISIFPLPGALALYYCNLLHASNLETLGYSSCMLHRTLLWTPVRYIICSYTHITFMLSNVIIDCSIDCSHMTLSSWISRNLRTKKKKNIKGY
jgi:hypothetical protein